MNELASRAQSYNHLDMGRPELFKNKRMRRDYMQSMGPSWLEVGFDLSILKRTWIWVEKLLACARQFIFLCAVIATVMHEENL